MRLRIGAHDYTVRYVRDLQNAEGSRLWGLCDSDAMTISLCDTLRKKPTKRIATVLHEAIHAIEEQRGLRLHEREVKVLGEALAQLLADNEWLRKRVLDIHSE